MKKIVALVLLTCGLLACGKSDKITGTDVYSPIIITPKPIDTGRSLPPVTPLPANQLYGYYAYGLANFEETCRRSNFGVVVTKSVAASVAAAEQAKRCRQQVSYIGEHWGDDWKTVGVSLIKPFADARVLHSVYVADEPMGQGMSYTELARRIALVHAQGWKAMYAEEGGHVEKPHPPVDYYGFDCYYLGPDGGPSSFCESMIQKHPEINIYVPYSFYQEPRQECGNFSYTMPDQRKQIELARRYNLGVVFFTWISWNSGGCYYTGVNESPEAQVIHQQYWSGR